MLKGVSHDIFDLHIFHDSNPSRPLINRLKYFRILFQFHWDIQTFKELHDVHPTVESDSTVSIPLQSQAPQCASYHGDWLCSVPWESQTCLFFYPKFYKCYFYVMPKDINMKCICLVTNGLNILFYFRSFFLKELKGVRNRKPRKTDIFEHVRLYSVMHTAESNCTPRSQNIRTL